MRNIAQSIVGHVLYLLSRWHLFPRPGVSMGICGSTTAGYGRLDLNGYWQFPAEKAAAEIERRMAAFQSCWTANPK